MATEDEKVLKESLEALRRSYDHISNIYDQLRLKALALIAGEVAIVSFIFANPVDRNLPKGTDRLIFFYVAIALLALAFGFMLWIISTVDWMLPHDSKRADIILSDKNRNTPSTFLKYLHDDYCAVNEHCNKIVSAKCRRFNWVVYTLAGGVIILMVLKFGGGLK